MQKAASVLWLAGLLLIWLPRLFTPDGEALAPWIQVLTALVFISFLGLVVVGFFQLRKKSSKGANDVTVNEPDLIANTGKHEQDGGSV